MGPRLDPRTGPEIAAAAPSGRDGTAAGHGDDLATLAGPFVALDAEQVARFRAYRRLLVAWNDRFNLTAVTDPAEMDRRLFLDALRMVPALDEVVATRVAPRVATRVARGGRRAARLVDLGSGAGFPGLALKVARPDLDVTLVEATGKKVDFLQRAIEELGIDRVVAVHARAEDLGRDPAYRGTFDIVTARAVAALPVLMELAAPLLRSGGWALFPKGLDLAAELDAGRAAGGVVGATVRSAARLGDAATRLVRVEKTGVTPARYPRRPGIPAREPLGGSAPPPAPRRGGPAQAGAPAAKAPAAKGDGR